MFQPLDYTFFIILLMLAGYFGYQFWDLFLRTKPNVDDGKLIEKYVFLQNLKVVRTKK